MGFYGHALASAFRQPDLGILALLRDTKCLAATAFFAVFGTIIAVMKVGHPTPEREAPV
jgi:hypothetical protein